MWNAYDDSGYAGPVVGLLFGMLFGFALCDGISYAIGSQGLFLNAAATPYASAWVAVESGVGALIASSDGLDRGTGFGCLLGPMVAGIVLSPLVAFPIFPLVTVAFLIILPFWVGSLVADSVETRIRS
jgi:hypothetical protein